MIVKHTKAQLSVIGIVENSTLLDFRKIRSLAKSCQLKSKDFPYLNLANFLNQTVLENYFKYKCVWRKTCFNFSQVVVS